MENYILEALQNLRGINEDIEVVPQNEVESVALNKVVTKNGINYKIVGVEPHYSKVGDYFFNLEQLNGKPTDVKKIMVKAIAKGLYDTKDEDLKILCVAIDGDIERDQAEKDAEKAEIKRQNIEREKELKQKELELKIEATIEKATLDAQNNYYYYYKLLTKNKFSKKLNNFLDIYDEQTYITAFEKERSKILAQNRAINNSGISFKNYPGDLDELLKWLRSHATSLLVLAGGNTADREQAALDDVNNRLGTNYKVTYTNNTYPFPSYKIRFKEPETAPKEFLNWIINKHSGETKDISVWNNSKPLTKTGYLTSNSLCKELIYDPNYDFKILSK